MPNLFRPTFVPVGSGFINKNKVPYGINPLQHHTFVCLIVAETRTNILRLVSVIMRIINTVGNHEALLIYGFSLNSVQVPDL